MTFSCLHKLLTTVEVFSLCILTILELLNLDPRLLHTGDQRYVLLLQKTGEMNTFKELYV